ncbi:nitrilase-related carbon-nitrogen hydrolase [Neotabrizicola sp. VNH66]|uniref:nitrilase-related carbon-nitrogen hydrolase n=1 Tax=Neotabrizicola sp. VNH66 TaxID=3400918 RepID=UPI003C034FD3
MRIAVWQGHSPAADLEQALSEAETALAAAGVMGATVLVLPEVWLPGYNAEGIPALALQREAPELQRLAVAARRAGCALALGYAERERETVYNAAVVFGADGTQFAHYRKVQLYGARERALYTPGEALVTFPLAGEIAALLICYDIEFAPHIRALADRGATLILCPTANMQPFTHVPDVTVRAMAANHGVAVAYSNFCGAEGDLTYTGRSLIAGPHGEIVAQAGETPCLLIADLPPRDPARISTQGTDLRPLT